MIAADEPHYLINHLINRGYADCKVDCRLPSPSAHFMLSHGRAMGFKVKTH